MPKRVSDEKKRFWHDLLERQRTSGLNVARFCAQASVSQNSFYAWKRGSGQACDHWIESRADRALR